MTVYKRTWKTKEGKTSAWYINVTYKSPTGERIRIREPAPGTSRRDAEVHEQQVIAALVNGTYGTHDPDDVPLFEEFAWEWFRDYVEVENKPSVQRTRRSILKAHLIPFFGKVKLDEIGKRDVARFKGQRQRQGLSPKTINNHLGVLSSLLNTAIEWEVIEDAPKVKWLKTRDSELDFLDFDEADRLVDGAENPEIRAMIQTAIKTGMRLGELCALRWQDVDLKKARVRVCRSATRGIVSTPKNGRMRILPISPDLVDALRKHRRNTKLRGELVFSDDEGGMLNRDRVKRPIARACRKAELREVGWHTLRHTYASHLVMLGVPLKAVQELMGHQTIEMTMRYAHLAPDVKTDAVRLLDTRGNYGLERAKRMSDVSQ